MGLMFQMEVHVLIVKCLSVCLSVCVVCSFCFIQSLNLILEHPLLDLLYLYWNKNIIQNVGAKGYFPDGCFLSSIEL